MAKNPEGHNPKWWKTHPNAKRPPETGLSNPSMHAETYRSAMPLYLYPVSLTREARQPLRNWSKQFWKELPKKTNDVLSLLSVLLTLAAWGHSVLSPEPQIWLGITLMLGAFLCFAALLIHLLNLRWKGKLFVLVLIATMFWEYTSRIVIAPAYKREFLVLLQQGYDLRGECQSRQYNDEAPRFIAESEDRWMASVETTLRHARKLDDVQLWDNSEFAGLAVHANIIGFRCTRMAVKLAALETIVSRHYDPTITPNPYTGPVYVLDPSHGAKIKLPDGGTIELHVSGDK
jgi:hypothetical protein